MKKSKIKFLAIALLMAFFLIWPANSQISGKSYVLRLNYHKTQNAEIISFITIYELDENIPQISDAAAGYAASMLSTKGNALYTRKFNVPKRAAAFRGLTEDISGTADDLNFTLYLPYYTDLGTIDIYGPSGRKMFSVLVKEPEQNLPAEQQLNSEEEPVQSIFPDYSWMYVVAPIALILSLLAYVEFRRQKHHAGLMAIRRENEINGLRRYVYTNLSKGFSRQQVRNALAKADYNNYEIEEAFKNIK